MKCGSSSLLLHIWPKMWSNFIGQRDDSKEIILWLGHHHMLVVLADVVGEDAGHIPSHSAKEFKGHYEEDYTGASSREDAVCCYVPRLGNKASYDQS
jgi:hypothetical protein